MERDVYLLSLTHTYNVQQHRSTEVLAFTIAITRTSSHPATVVSKHASLATADNVDMNMYERPQLVILNMDLEQEMDKKIKL